MSGAEPMTLPRKDLDQSQTALLGDREENGTSGAERPSPLRSTRPAEAGVAPMTLPRKDQEQSQTALLGDREENGTSGAERPSPLRSTRPAEAGVAPMTLPARKRWDTKEEKPPHTDVDTVLLTTRKAIRVGDMSEGLVLVDGGSTHNIVGKAFADREGLTYVDTKSFATLQYANELSVVEPLLKAEKVLVTLKGEDGRTCSLFLNFHVSPSLRKYDCIIGKNALANLSRNFKLHTDYHHNTLEVTNTAGEQVTVQMDVTTVTTRCDDLIEVRMAQTSFETGQATDVGTETDPRLQEVLERHAEAFGKVDGRRQSKLPFKVEVKFRGGKPPSPIPSGHYRLGPLDTDIMADTLHDLLARGIVEKAPLARHISPCFLAKKNGTDEKGRPRRRFVVDFVCPKRRRWVSRGNRGASRSTLARRWNSISILASGRARIRRTYTHARS